MRRGRTSWQSGTEPERAEPSGGDEPPALERRLEALLESERDGQELLDQLRSERWAAQRKDSERRIASIEEALAGARAEAEERKELERKLAQMRIEVVRLTIELDNAEQAVEQARKIASARVAHRHTAAEETLSGVSAQLKREREDPADAPRRGRRFRRERRAGKEEVACRVCKRTWEGDETSGWIVGPDAGLCPDCQAEGWQVAVEGGLPFRRSMDRQIPD